MNCGVRVSLSQAFVLPGIKCEGICGSARTGCLPYTILPIQNVINRFHERQLPAQQRAEKSGVEFIPPDKGQSA